MLKKLSVRGPQGAPWGGSWNDVPGRRGLGVSRAGRLSRCLTPEQSQGLYEADGDRSGDLFQHI